METPDEEAASGDDLASDEGIAESHGEGEGEGEGGGEAESIGVAVAGSESLPLGVPASREGEGAEGFGSTAIAESGWLRTVGALLLVVVLIVGIRVGWMRLARYGAVGGGVRAQLGAGGRAPSGIVQVLGRYPVGRGQMLVLLKLDRRVLLLSQTAAGFATLSEISDAEEVASILTKARDEEGASLSSRFSALLRGMERDAETARTDDLRLGDGVGDRFGGAEMESFPVEVGGEMEIDEEGQADSAALVADAGEVLRRRLEGLRRISG